MASCSISVSATAVSAPGVVAIATRPHPGGPSANANPNPSPSSTYSPPHIPSQTLVFCSFGICPLIGLEPGGRPRLGAPLQLSAPATFVPSRVTDAVYDPHSRTVVLACRHGLLRLHSSNAVVPLAGDWEGGGVTAGDARDGVGPAASFGGPRRLASDGGGVLYVMDRYRYGTVWLYGIPGMGRSVQPCQGVDGAAGDACACGQGSPACGVGIGLAGQRLMTAYRTRSIALVLPTPPLSCYPPAPLPMRRLLPMLYGRRYNSTRFCLRLRKLQQLALPTGSVALAVSTVHELMDCGHEALAYDRTCGSLSYDGGMPYGSLLYTRGGREVRRLMPMGQSELVAGGGGGKGCVGVGTGVGVCSPSSSSRSALGASCDLGFNGILDIAVDEKGGTFVLDEGGPCKSSSSSSEGSMSMAVAMANLTRSSSSASSDTEAPTLRLFYSGGDSPGPSTCSSCSSPCSSSHSRTPALLAHLPGGSSPASARLVPLPGGRLALFGSCRHEFLLLHPQPRRPMLLLDSPSSSSSPSTSTSFSLPSPLSSPQSSPPPCRRLGPCGLARDLAALLPHHVLYGNGWDEHGPTAPTTGTGLPSTPHQQQHQDHGCGGGDAPYERPSPPPPDVTILVGGEAFPTHRTLLAARCGYFSRLFGGDFSESTAPEVPLSDASPAAFRCVLRHLYTGSSGLERQPRLTHMPSHPLTSGGQQQEGGACAVQQQQDQQQNQLQLWQEVAQLADRLLLPELSHAAQEQLLSGVTACSVVALMVWAEGMGFRALLQELVGWYVAHRAQVQQVHPGHVDQLAGCRGLAGALLAAGLW